MDVVKSLKQGSSDAERYIRYTAVELTAEHKSKPPKRRTQLLEQQAAIVAVRIYFHEKDLQLAVKQAGGKWQPENKVRLLAYEAVVQLGLQERIIHS